MSIKKIMAAAFASALAASAVAAAAFAEAGDAVTTDDNVLVADNGAAGGEDAAPNGMLPGGIQVPIAPDPDPAQGGDGEKGNVDTGAEGMAAVFGAAALAAGAIVVSKKRR